MLVTSPRFGSPSGVADLVPVGLGRDCRRDLRAHSSQSVTVKSRMPVWSRVCSGLRLVVITRGSGRRLGFLLVEEEGELVVDLGAQGRDVALVGDEVAHDFQFL
jgi:hypothetical protein